MLRRLTLRNFKSFRSAEIPLGPLTLIVGTNASGKSNIRDALRVLHGVGLGYTLPEIVGDKYGPGGLLWRGIRGGAREAGFHGESEFRLEVELDAPATEEPLGYGLTVDVIDSRSGPRVRAESLYEAGQCVFEAEDEDDWPHEYSERLGSVLVALRSMRFLDLDPEAMRQPSVPGQHILGDRGENLSSVLQAICEDASRKQTLRDWLQALTPMDAVDFEFIPDFSGRILVHLVESSGHKISALSASDGTLRFLALVAALLSPDTGRIFFFEELDTGLHPTRLHLLVQLVQQACRNHRVQVIGTTHNPALLTFLDEQARRDALLVYRTESAPDSRIRRIADLPDIETVLEKQDLGRLFVSGWLETAAELSEPDDAGDEP